MKAIRVAVALLALGSAVGVSLDAQEPGSVPSRGAPVESSQPPVRGGRGAPELEPPPAPVEMQQFEQFRYARPVFRFGIPLILGPGSQVSDATVVLSDATIEGRVEGDTAVILGGLRLGSTAVVEGSVVVVGGVVTVAEGAVIRDDFVVVGGTVDAPASFMPGGEHILIGPPGLGELLRSIGPFFTRGLLWGRVIVPDLPWVWGLIGISLIISLGLLLAFPGAVRACTETLSSRPLGSFFAGMFALLLIGPISTILAISVVGIVAIPFLIGSAVVGWLLGKVSVANWIGGGIVRQDEPDDRAQSIRSILIGFAVLIVAYMLPVLGLAAWTLVGVLGLGTATLTAMSRLKRERPQRLPKAAVPPPPPEPPASTLPIAGAPAPPVAPVAEANNPFEPSAGPASIGASDRPADLTGFPRATFLDRLAAFTLDLVLVLIAYNMLSWRHDEGMFFVLLLGYHMAFWAWKGTTVGGIVCNLRLVRTDGTPLRPADALVRGLSSLFSFFALGIGFLWILRDPERQAWHDKIAGTYVVSVPRSWALP